MGVRRETDHFFFYCRCDSWCDVGLDVRIDFGCLGFDVVVGVDVDVDDDGIVVVDVDVDVDGDLDGRGICRATSFIHVTLL